MVEKFIVTGIRTILRNKVLRKITFFKSLKCVGGRIWGQLYFEELIFETMYILYIENNFVKEINIFGYNQVRIHGDW